MFLALDVLLFMFVCSVMGVVLTLLVYFGFGQWVFNTIGVSWLWPSLPSLACTA